MAGDDFRKYCDFMYDEPERRWKTIDVREFQKGEKVCLRHEVTNEVVLAEYIKSTNAAMGYDPATKQQKAHALPGTKEDKAFLKKINSSARLLGNLHKVNEDYARRLKQGFTMTYHLLREPKYKEEVVYALYNVGKYQPGPEKDPNSEEVKAETEMLLRKMNERRGGKKTRKVRSRRSKTRRA